jgi:hypothetical protein
MTGAERQSQAIAKAIVFAQLIGYSLSGFGELPYVSEETFKAAAAGPLYELP